MDNIELGVPYYKINNEEYVIVEGYLYKKNEDGYWENVESLGKVSLKYAFKMDEERTKELQKKDGAVLNSL